MDSGQYDAMLQEMTLAVREMYENQSDRQMGEHETQSLNDLLDTFFGEKCGQ